MLRWARARSGLDSDAFSKKFPNFDAWEQGTKLPTLRQLRQFAAGTYTPLGYLFLDRPPEEKMPISDLRAGLGGYPTTPSPHLLDTIYRCQQRQEWYRAYATSHDLDPIPFVGTSTNRADILTVAEEMRRAIDFNVDARSSVRTWTEALSIFRRQVEQSGVLIMMSSMVGNNKNRKLSPDEFRGFALVDTYAPLIFINSADSKAAQMFTIAHELAHLWIGAEGVSDIEPRTLPGADVEGWCNQVAADFLVPEVEFRSRYKPFSPLEQELAQQARYFKVSSLVILRCIRDLGGINRRDFNLAYDRELEKAKQARARQTQRSRGGDPYRTKTVRVGERFARAVITSTLEGDTTYAEALSLLEIATLETFHNYARRLGFNV